MPIHRRPKWKLLFMACTLFTLPLKCFVRMESPPVRSVIDLSNVWCYGGCNHQFTCRISCYSLTILAHFGYVMFNCRLSKGCLCFMLRCALDLCHDFVFRTQEIGIQNFVYCHFEIQLWLRVCANRLFNYCTS